MLPVDAGTLRTRSATCDSTSPTVTVRVPLVPRPESLTRHGRSVWVVAQPAPSNPLSGSVVVSPDRLTVARE